MKKITKVLSVMMILAMLLSMTGIIASAAPTTGTITIENAAKGETYKIYKLFSASVTGKDDGSIVYTGTIPDALTAYFEVQDGYIVAKDYALSPEAIAAMKTWAESQVNADKVMVAEGGPVVFTEVPFGYYVVTSSQGDKAISVTSTNPNAVIKDKNSTTVIVGKTVDDKDVYIGQTVNYELKVDTITWNGDNYVTEYLIQDTLPSFLTDIQITSVTIDNVPNSTEDTIVNLDIDAFSESTELGKYIAIDWYDETSGKHIYNNGAVISIKYSAKVTAAAVVDGAGNKNTMTVTVKDNGPQNEWEKFTDEETIWTYALSLKKVDENGAGLDGATFKIAGLTVAPAQENTVGDYIVTAYDPNGTDGTVMQTDKNGVLIIRGVAKDVNEEENAALINYVLTEVNAPNGYNKLKDPVTLNAKVTGVAATVTSTVVYYDANGEVTNTKTERFSNEITLNDELKAENIVVEIENKKGTELPETGGMGTTMFIVLGSFTALVFAVVLVARKKTAGYR